MLNSFVKLKKLLPKVFDINDNNSLSKIASLKNRKYDEIIIGALSEKEAEIPKKPKMGTTTVQDNYGEDKRLFIINSNLFSESIQNYNNICQKVLSVAIKNGNQYLAQRAVSKFKSNIFVENPRYFTFVVTVDNNDINAAKATYQEAIKSGAFR